MTQWYRHVRPGFWCLWMCAAMWAASQWRTPNPIAPRDPSTLQPAQLAGRARADSSLALLGELLDRMPFDNAELLDLRSEASAVAADPLVSHTDAPRLVLSGIVDGVVPQAIVDGLPGSDGGRALRIGEKVGDVRLLQVDRERAVLEISGTRTALFIGRSTLVPP